MAVQAAKNRSNVQPAGKRPQRRTLGKYGRTG